ncbi:MAG: acyl carrier protein [Candidatus Geothermincolia bacterium]
MDRAEILGKIAGALSEQLDIPMADIEEGSRFKEDLDADSLDLVELLLMMEEEYGFTISDEEAERIITVADAINLVLERASA